MDKYYVYRPLINLIGKTEGTAPPKGRGYNETLDYGAYTNGDVTLVTMTLDEVDILQTKMLRHPKNKWNSSAVGWGQIVRTTLRSIRETLKLTGGELFNEDMQDRMICYLLGLRGIDKYLAGRLSEATLMKNLSAEWASFPKPDGKGTYEGQNVGTNVAELRKVLAEVKRRHKEGQPKEVVTVVPKPFDKPVTQTSGFWERIGQIGGLSAIGGLAAFFQDWKAVLAMVAGLIVLALFGLLLHKRIIDAVQNVKKAASDA